MKLDNLRAQGSDQAKSSNQPRREFPPQGGEPSKGKRQSLGAWAIAALAVLGLAAIASQFAPGPWYEALNKPSWQPPGWAFAPIWASLYLLVATSLALLLQQPESEQRRRALLLFGLHFVLNAAWPLLFFALRAPVLAFVDICMLWAVTIGAVTAAMRVRPASAWLLLPLLLWVSFELVLNGVIIALN